MRGTKIKEPGGNRHNCIEHRKNGKKNQKPLDILGDKKKKLLYLQNKSVCCEKENWRMKENS